MIKFAIKNRFSGEAQFTAEIDCGDDASTSVKIGLAVKWAIKSGADLSGADLYGANLSRANLYGVELPTDTAGILALKRTRILPEGDLIGWKKCRDGVIVKPLIPESAKRSHAWGRKCRAQFVDVLAVIGAEVGISEHDGKTEYREGQRVTPHEWDDDWREECGGGIHFYITREEAEAHT